MGAYLPHACITLSWLQSCLLYPIEDNFAKRKKKFKTTGEKISSLLFSGFFLGSNGCLTFTWKKNKF